MQAQHKHVVLLSGIGGALEFFDFTIYALFARLKRIMVEEDLHLLRHSHQSNQITCLYQHILIYACQIDQVLIVIHSIDPRIKVFSNILTIDVCSETKEWFNKLAYLNTYKSISDGYGPNKNMTRIHVKKNILLICLHLCCMQLP